MKEGEMRRRWRGMSRGCNYSWSTRWYRRRPLVYHPLSAGWFTHGLLLQTFNGQNM